MRGQDTVSVLKGVGEQREKRLHRLGIVTVGGFATHYPREYKDRSEILKLQTCRRMNLQPFWRR